MNGRRRGRPTLYKMRSDIHVVLRVTSEQKRALQQVAAAERRDMSKVIRDAIDSYVGDFQEETMFSGASK